MFNFCKLFSLSVSFIFTAAVASAAVCDYRPSSIIGDTGAAMVGGGAAGAAAAGSAANVAGVYTLVHATSGATMIGGTWAGASAAGTAGIIGGTAGALGTATAIVTAPATIIGAVVVAAGVAIYEGGCYFTDIRITEYDEINMLVADIAKTAPANIFKYFPGPADAEGAYIVVRNPDTAEAVYDTYEVSNLYVVNGTLKNDSWGFNTTIGNLAMIVADNSEQ